MRRAHCCTTSLTFWKMFQISSICVAASPPRPGSCWIHVRTRMTRTCSTLKRRSKSFQQKGFSENWNSRASHCSSPSSEGVDPSGRLPIHLACSSPMRRRMSSTSGFQFSSVRWP